MANIDGVKKASDADLETKRRIILGMIGEGEGNTVAKETPVKTRESAASFPSARKAPMVDLAKVYREKEAELAKARQAEEDTAKEKEAQEALLAAEKARKDGEEKMKLEAERRQAKNAEERKAKEIEEARKTEERRMTSADKPVLAATEKKADQAHRASKPDVPKEREADVSKDKRVKHAKRKAFRLRIAALRKSIRSFKAHMSAVIYYLMVFSFSLLSFHLIFILIVLSVRPEGAWVRAIGKLLYVPAIAIRGHAVDYFSFLDVKREAGSDEAAARRIIGSIITSSLLEKHKASSVAELDKLAVYDREMNSVSMSRIAKIKKLIEDGGDFIEVSKKYGEELKKSDISLAEMNKLPYGDQLKKLDIGERTDIITGEDGYYIFMCSERYNDRISVSYVFIKAKTASEYISQAVEGANYLSFIN